MQMGVRPGRKHIRNLGKNCVDGFLSRVHSPGFWSIYTKGTVLKLGGRSCLVVEVA